MHAFPNLSIDIRGCEIQMPFYLVTHTALVEAEDEVGAAEKVMADLLVKPRMTFSVKLDENSIKHVSVTRQTDVADRSPAAKPAIDEMAGVADEIAGSEPAQQDQPVVHGTNGQARSIGMIAVVCLAFAFAACGLAGLAHFGVFSMFR